MCQWTTDSQRLILEHFDMICDSPSYIYQFALPISPSSSWLHQYYSGEFSQQFRVVREVSAGWGACFRTVWLDDYPRGLAYCKDTVAVGLQSGSIIILNAVTGTQVAILSGHTKFVKSLVFFPDGTSLVSGSGDNTIKLWDLQTGGVVQTFQGHTNMVVSVSISADCTTIASGSFDHTICLWDIQMGECHYTIKQKSYVSHVCFSPLDPKHLVSISENKIWHWNTCGQQTAPAYNGSYIAFSLDGTKFAVYSCPVIEVRSSDSNGIMAKLHIVEKVQCCCFSPDNRVIAVAIDNIIRVWDITSSDPHLLETFTGENNVSLVFSSPSSLISASNNYSAKFWKIGALSPDSVLTDLKSAPLTSAPINSITLQAKDGIAISSHSDGVVRIWNISTGLCNKSFQIPVKDFHQVDTRLTNGRLISIWHADEHICIWDTEKGAPLRIITTSRSSIEDMERMEDLRISGDGSKVFYLQNDSIQAWSIQTGEVVEVGYESDWLLDLLVIDGPEVWIHPDIGWDFGILGSSPVKLSHESRNGPHLDFVGGIRMKRSYLPGIEDIVTRKVVFQLPQRLARCSDAQWDGQYLVVGYDSGEVLILECNYVLH